MRIENQAVEKENMVRVTHDRITADGCRKTVSDVIITEHALELYVDAKPAMKMVCSPDHLPELVIGRLITSGMIRQPDEVESIVIGKDGARAEVFLKEKAEAAERNVNGQKKEYPPEWIFAMAEAFSCDSEVHKKTKGAHACYLGIRGEIIFSAEDIGRHNAMDKVIGYAAMHGISPEDCMLYTSGRVPTDMVKKVIAAGIPILISKAVPTDSAVRLAEEYGVTLICRAWQEGYDLY